MSKKTCGPMYKEALEKYATSVSEVRAFAAGFVSGQAEKVYLGACRAAMFRPSQDRYGMLIETVSDVAVRYGLIVVAPIGSRMEIWITTAKHEEDVRSMMLFIENSPNWHARRAWLCGVEDVDLEFHLREGHGQRCD